MEQVRPEEEVEEDKDAEQRGGEEARAQERVEVGVSEEEEYTLETSVLAEASVRVQQRTGMP